MTCNYTNYHVILLCNMNIESCAKIEILASHTVLNQTLSHTLCIHLVSKHSKQIVPFTKIIAHQPVSCQVSHYIHLFYDSGYKVTFLSVESICHAMPSYSLLFSPNSSPVISLSLCWWASALPLLLPPPCAALGTSSSSRISLISKH